MIPVVFKIFEIFDIFYHGGPPGRGGGLKKIENFDFLKNGRELRKTRGSGQWPGVGPIKKELSLGNLVLFADSCERWYSR